MILNRFYDPNTPKVAAVVLFYMAAALIMVFVNKAVLNNSPSLPLLFLLNQMLIAVLLLHASAFVSTRIEIPKFELATAKKLFAVVAVNAIGLVFNTLCLRDVEASFFQIARGLVLPLTIIVSCLNTRTSPSLRTIIAAILVTLGFLVGVAPSSALPKASAPSIISLVYGILSSLFIAFHAVLIKSSLPHCHNSTIQLAYWTNAGTALLLAPFVVFAGELANLQGLIYESTWDGRVFMWGSLMTGVFGFLLCVAGLLSIQVTSPITHMFSSAGKSVLQTVLGVVIYEDIMTVNRMSSISIITLGAMYYTWVKSAESTPSPRKDIDLEAMRERQILQNDGDNDEAAVIFSIEEKKGEDKT
ncbi:hypothetical protein CONPUDRAFT_96183 [Coniophora puteana RWD-64-598 SS2]|uniref:Sugar phosphate transporter domain-containing protein n=1 Tax=Coniophora puteana (strain RWD-64-598) TaxID=741705 RepID=A0A5M3N841_CONPW|nr:uncharacterized protein CONPUDRAFT_96183 [Coniophora puteana RWD-64-598 SS2]EIW87021.1 hypothetical protein CONPUDRAFT_96183 [Coniophora puteana RWD-64-598 SS2]